MADDSLDEFLGWDIAQNKTVTAWSSKVSVKNRGRKTYGSSRGGSFSSQRRTIRESDEHIIANGFSFANNDDEEEEDELEGVAPPVPPPTRLTRANSVTTYDRRHAPRMRRSNSISHGARDDTMIRAGFPRRSSISFQSLRSMDSFAENEHPNLGVLEEFVSPKRAKTTIEFPGRKRAKSGDRGTGLKKPLSDSFSNLAKFGEDRLSWAKTAITEVTSSFNNSDSAVNDNDYEQIEFADTSPAAASVGSSRKRGIWDSPPDDFDDFSLSEAPSTRRTRFFSPARTPGPNPSPNAAAGGKGTDSVSLMSVGSEDRPRTRKEGLDTDDELSVDDVSVDSLLEAKTPMNDVSHYGNHSIGGLSPDLLDVRNAGPDDIINTMSSYQDLRFLVKSLRKEKASSRTSWHVAPPVAWESQRRAAFLHWATRTLGFSFRSGGMAITYLQISKAKGAEILQLLESAVTSWKDQGFAEQTPLESSKKLKFTFSSIKKTLGAPRTLALTPKESTTSTFNAGSSAFVDDLSSRMMSLGMSDKKKSLRFSDQHMPMGAIILEDSEDMSFMEGARPSLENHTNARDLMAHMHGVTPITRKGRPPRLSIESTGSTGVSGMSGGIFNDMSPYPQPAQSFGNDCMTPMMTKPDPGWGSCPVAGRDWGASEACSPEIIEELVRRVEQSGIDAGIVDDTTTPLGSRNSSDSSNLFDLELEAASNEHETSASSLDTPGDNFHSALDNIVQAKQDRRRQTSFAKHARMSLIASAVNPSGSMLNGRKSLFDRPSNAFLGTDFALAETLEATPEFAPYNDATLDDPVCSRRTALADDGVLETIFSFLQETELLCTASLVSIHWADCATQAHANMMLMSVGCTSESDTDSTDDDSIAEEAMQTYGFMEREWEFLVSSFPWACFLSEGAFKRVYKVFNYNHRVEEAISVMDVNTIESTGNMNVVGAELAVSVLLSSLVRRGVCPNFVVTRGVFSCAYEPPARSWGSATNKRPKGSTYVSPKAKRLPKEPAQNKRGRYQYIRMELCDEGDAEEYLKRQPDGAIDPLDSMKLLFQMAFSLHAAADRFSLKHYDVKLLNFFLQGVTTEKAGDVVMRYGLGAHTFALKSQRGQGIIAKLADYGTANVDSGSCGQAVTIAQFTTLENTPIDFLILGDAAHQGHGHDCFGLGLCMLHLYTGHAPYEEILEEVTCPPNLKKELRTIWENEAESNYSVIRSLILSEVYKDEEGHIIEGEPDEVLYDTLYRFLVLFGVPDVSSTLSNSKVWIAIKNTLESKSNTGKAKKSGGKKSQRNESTQFNRDRRKYSLSRGNNKYIARARKSLESLHGGMDLLLSLVSFDPQTRASALDVLNSPFMTPLREEEEESQYSEDDEVLTYNAFSIKRT
mmetsp:Transcript_487/g.769  ORF Transcript_487/g.769 Transcript_487/m.769 type:complete len:1375 (-) Transcript_487:1532-5656(-)|eukprot:CAMPEP_0113621612 /NCGR_PEP_ID=MMETSP0017_2-20120614/11051_1 /TAXON_ID=2856 /ORGANISM="Cylindrotheca closterium" /LENGTH=1374 /DNA_ID=CAMNT_0000531375 /DNA_START=62 /DNA_END=4186 /DNA_ORIENTATION=+ /assembly_acc=CAM_ASM_000147